MGSATLNSRLQYLLAQQNADGGWGHYPGQASWLEPTVYAAFALVRAHPSNVERAWGLVRSWQRADGAFRPCRAVDEPHWATSLVINGLACANPLDEACRKAVGWLLGVEGAEGGWLNSVLKRFITMPADQNEELHGWPWRPGTASWIEPTAHGLVALRRANPAGSKAARRLRLGQAMILERRCEDGGWNYGNRKVYNVAVPSYPETTGLALLGAQGMAGLELTRRRTLEMWRARPRGLGRAWLTIGMQCHGWEHELAGVMDESLPPGGDLTLAAIEAIALQPETVERYFRTGAKA